jgi:hypothetical protein
MAVDNHGRRSSATRFTGAWIGLGILILAVLAWLVYSFFLIGSEPTPPPVDFQQPAGQVP